MLYRMRIKKTAEITQISAVSMVGTPGFEPGASWTRTKRDTKLRHVPLTVSYYIRLYSESQEHYYNLEE